MLSKGLLSNYSITSSQPNQTGNYQLSINGSDFGGFDTQENAMNYLNSWASSQGYSGIANGDTTNNNDANYTPPAGTQDPANDTTNTPPPDTTGTTGTSGGSTGSGSGGTVNNGADGGVDTVGEGGGTIDSGIGNITSSGSGDNGVASPFNGISAALAFLNKQLINQQTAAALQAQAAAAALANRKQALTPLDVGYTAQRNAVTNYQRKGALANIFAGNDVTNALTSKPTLLGK